MPGRFQRVSPVLPSLLPFSKLPQSLQGLVLARATPDHPAFASIADLLYPVTVATRNDNEVHHVYPELENSCQDDFAPSQQLVA